MKLPPGLTETEFLETVDHVLSILVPSHVFGPYSAEDIFQEGRLLAIQAMDKGLYDPSRPLANYLYVHLRNRFLNLKRDKLRRCDAPCSRCHEGDFCTDEGLPCSKYQGWRSRQDAKSSLMKTVAGNPVRDVANEEDASDLAEREEILLKIDLQLPLEMRADYLAMRSGCSISKTRRKEIEEAVLEIVGDSLNG